MPRPKSVKSRGRQDEWELHRRELSRLFLVEGLPVAQIAKYMKNEHGFDKKPKDYEYRLKKWHLRRNLHETELRSIRSQLSRREQAGQRSEIVVSGIRWSESMVRGRLERHIMSSCLSSNTFQVKALPDFLARVQTPSPLMLDLPEWPRELPWLEFNRSKYRALATLTMSTAAGRMCRPRGEEALSIQMLRPYIKNNSSKKKGLEHAGVYSVPPPRRMRAMLEVVAPQAHTGDHETAAEILHTGSHESLAVELVRLLIYFESNNMVQKFEDIMCCKVDLKDSANMMDFLRGVGFLNKANINWLRGRTDPTSQTFLDRLLAHSITDEASLDALKWLTQAENFDVNQILYITDGNPGEWHRKHVWYADKMGVKHSYYAVCRTLLQASCLAGNIDAVSLILDLGADPYGNSALPVPTPLELAASLACHARARTITGLLLSKQTTASSDIRKAAMERALEIAIAGAHTEVVVRLLSERERLGHWRICSQHLTIAAEYADIVTVRLLVDNASLHNNGPVQLPEYILFSAMSTWHRGFGGGTRPGEILERLNYFLAIGASPSVPRCRHGCMGSLCLDSVLIASEVDRTTYGSAIGEDCLLNIIEVMRKHGCPLETPRPTSSGEHRASALQMAIKLGYSRLVECLLDWGADIDFLQYERKSAMSTCKDCKRDICRTLDPIEGCSPLLTALSYKKIGIAKMLLRRNPNLRLRGGEPELAMKSGDDPELVTMLLLAESANVNEWRILFEQAASMKNPESIKTLLSMASSRRSSIDPGMIMRAALITGDYDEVYQQATACGYDSRVLFEVALHSHRDREYHEIVECLLQLRRDKFNDDFEIRAVACAAIHHDAHLLGCLMQYFERGPWMAEFPPTDTQSLSNWVPRGDNKKMHIFTFAAEFNSAFKDETPLKSLLEFHIPATEVWLEKPEDMSVETLSKLIAAGCDPNQGLFLLPAVEANMLAHVRVLCEAHVDLNTIHESITNGSRNATQTAIESGSPEMLQMLLDYGADVDYPAGPFSGATCLQLAAEAGDIGLVRLLLRKGASVNAKRSLFYGRTAVEIAAENGRLDVLKLLLLQEPLFQSEAERYQFIRAVDFAEANGHELLANMLRQHINWNSDDQQLFDDMLDCEDLRCHLDDMTQRVSESEERHSCFWLNLEHIAEKAGLNDIYDIDGIEEWIGWGFYDSDSEGEAGVYSSDSLANADRPAAHYDELVADLNDLADPTPTHDAACDYALAYLRTLGVELGEESGSNSQSSTANSGWDPRQTALAPQAVRCDHRIPMWLDMDDNRCDAADDIPRLRVAEQRPATRNLHQMSGMVLGEVQGTHTNDVTFSPINMEGGSGEVDHSQHFDWGFWDEEGVGREIPGLDLSFDSMHHY